MINLLLKILFFFVFVGVITPVGLLLRLFGVDYLRRSFRADEKSYWIDV